MINKKTITITTIILNNPSVFPQFKSIMLRMIHGLDLTLTCNVALFVKK